MIDEVTIELQCEENTEEAKSMEEVQKIVEEFQEFPQWLIKCCQPDVHFTNEIEY